MKAFRFKKLKTLVDKSVLTSMLDKKCVLVQMENANTSMVINEVQGLLNSDIINSQQYNAVEKELSKEQYKGELFDMIRICDPFLFYEMSQVNINICDTEDKCIYQKSKIVLPDKGCWECIYQNKENEKGKYIKQEKWVLNFKIYQSAIVMIESFNKNNEIFVYEPCKDLLTRALTK